MYLEVYPLVLREIYLAAEVFGHQLWKIPAHICAEWS